MRLVILDRDGVINADSPDYIKSPGEWIPLEGSLQAIAALTRAGFTVVVASNQSGVARGLFSLKALEAINETMLAAVADAGGCIDAVFFCPHGPGDNCDCRKPRPGLLRQIADHYGASLEGVPVVGDSLRDLQAAWAVDARAILVLSGNGQHTRKQCTGPVEVHADLAAVACALIAEHGP